MVGFWEPNTPELLKCSQLLPRVLDTAGTPGEVVQQPEGPVVVILTYLRSDTGCDQDVKGLLGQVKCPLK